MEYQKKAEETDDWLLINLLIGLQKFKKNQRQLQMRMIKKHLKKDIHLQKKKKKLLIIWDNSIIMEYQKTINLLDNTLNQPTKYRRKIGLK